MKRGMRMQIDHAMYPKNEGIFTLFSSQMDFTMKLGAFPIYVFAPMKTEPAEMANRIFWGMQPPITLIPLQTPEAVMPRVFPSERNVIYVGALSRKLESTPDIQKNCQG